MTPQQMVHHEENRELVARVVAKWRKYRFLSEADQRRLMIALQNMRMSCNSTYLLDQTTDHGVKVGELATLLGEMFEQPQTKVVVFSQWVRMHELIVRRMKETEVGPRALSRRRAGNQAAPTRRAASARTTGCRAFLSD